LGSEAAIADAAASLGGAVTETIGKYLVLGLLGQGAMGRVYRAEDPHIGRLVAIKVMTLGADASPERFQREARIIGNLSHPNIVVIHDFGFHEGQPFLVMELLDGLDLKQWMQRPHPLDEHLRVMVDLCSAVSYAHSRGVLHRDIKPANVQVLGSGNGKLMDFGIARGEISDLTASGTVMGSPMYMAPEILGNQPASTSSDIYAVGMICYEMLSGSNPFVATSLAACVNQILTATPRSLHQCRPDLPRELTDAVMECIDKNPAGRAPHLDRLATAVRAARDRSSSSVSDDETGQAATVMLGTTRPPERRGSRSRRFLWAEVILVLGAVLAGIFTFSGLWPRSQRNRAAVISPSPTAGAVELERTPPRTPSASETPTPIREHTTSSPDRLARTQVPVRTGMASPTPLAQPPVSSLPTQVPAAHTQPTTTPTTTPTRRVTRTSVPVPTSPPSPTPLPPSTHQAAPVPAKLVLTSADPDSFRLGGSVHVMLTGAGFHSGMRLELVRGRRPAVGFTLSHLRVISDTRAEVDILIDPSMPLGHYAILLVGADGQGSDRLDVEVQL